MTKNVILAMTVKISNEDGSKSVTLKLAIDASDALRTSLFTMFTFY
jgi:hypothetical protein